MDFMYGKYFRYVRFVNTLYKQIIGIPMDANCAPFSADLV